METSKSIIENDIELYTAFTETMQEKLRRCHVDKEEGIQTLILKHMNVLIALRELQLEIISQRNS